MIEMNQVESTKLFQRTETLQIQLVDVMKQLVIAEEQFIEITHLPDGSVQHPDTATLTEFDNSLRIQTSTSLGMIMSLIHSWTGFLESVKVQCVNDHHAFLPQTGTKQ
jgi:hypothetical protein